MNSCARKAGVCYGIAHTGDTYYARKGNQVDRQWKLVENVPIYSESGVIMRQANERPTKVRLLLCKNKRYCQTFGDVLPFLIGEVRPFTNRFIHSLRRNVVKVQRNMYVFRCKLIQSVARRWTCVVVHKFVRKCTYELLRSWCEVLCTNVYAVSFDACYLSPDWFWVIRKW